MNQDTEPAERVEREIIELAAQLERGLARWIALVGEYDGLDAARAAGFRGTAEWLAWRCQISSRTAREHVRVARRLAELPAIRAEFASGDLSYSKVRAVTRAHACMSEPEPELLDRARRMTAAQLEAHVRALPSAPSADPDVERAVYQARYVDYRWDEQGALRLHGRLPAVEGAALVEAIETAAESLHPATEEDVEEEDRSAAAGAKPSPRWRPPLSARRADALCELGQSGAPGARVVLHTTRATLCALEGGPAVPVESGRRLSCDALVEESSGSDLGRTRRVVSPPLRAALERRDGGCRFPGCGRRHGLHAHHIKHWSNGGTTDQSNLIMLCRYHHRLVHEGGFNVIHNDHQLVFKTPKGRLVTAPPAPVAGYVKC